LDVHTRKKTRSVPDCPQCGPGLCIGYGCLLKQQLIGKAELPALLAGVGTLADGLVIKESSVKDVDGRLMRGLFADRPFKKGTAVVTYGGELITLEEAKLRKLRGPALATMYFLHIPGNHSYLVDGSHFSRHVAYSPDAQGIYRSDYEHALHAGSMVNHSTTPNLKFDAVQDDSDRDRLLPGIPICRATCDILAGAELLVNYSSVLFHRSAELVKEHELNFQCEPLHFTLRDMLAAHHIVQARLDEKVFSEHNLKASLDLSAGLSRIQVGAFGNSLVPSPSHGVCNFQVTDNNALIELTALEGLLHQNFETSTQADTDCHGLLAFTDVRRFNGYGEYPSSVAALSGLHNSDEQMKRTAAARTVADVALLLDNPKCGALITSALAMVLKELGLEDSKTNRKKCRRVHLLLQDLTDHASFGWHVDDSEIKMNRNLITAILQLSVVPTAMRMYLFREGYVYSGRGAGCLFPGAAIHSSTTIWPHPAVDLKGRVFKIAFFLDNEMEAV